MTAEDDEKQIMELAEFLHEGEWEELTEAVKENRMVLVALMGLLLRRGLVCREELATLFDRTDEALEAWEELRDFMLFKSTVTD